MEIIWHFMQTGHMFRSMWELNFNISECFFVAIQGILAILCLQRYLQENQTPHILIQNISQILLKT